MKLTKRSGSHHDHDPERPEDERLSIGRSYIRYQSALETDLVFRFVE